MATAASLIILFSVASSGTFRYSPKNKMLCGPDSFGLVHFSLNVFLVLFGMSHCFRL